MLTKERGEKKIIALKRLKRIIKKRKITLEKKYD
jgi:hypothetical protein